MTVPSIGDILLLSQQAWKIGRAFTAGRSGAPAEFLEVESEINGLAKTLKLLAETLFAEADDSLVEKADRATHDGFATIVTSCQRTVTDLDSLMDQYQVIKKHKTPGGFAIERSWSDLVLAQYQVMMWTTEGGNIKDLRTMLQMHTSTLSLITKALKSKSSSRLEGIIAPIADQIDAIHHKTGRLGEQLGEAQRIVQDIAGTDQSPTETPTAGPNSPEVNPSPQVKPDEESFSPRDFLPPRQSSRVPPGPSLPQQPQSPHRSPAVSTTVVPSMPSSPATSPTITARKRISEFSFGGPGSRYSGSYASTESTDSTSPVLQRGMHMARQPSIRASSYGRSPEGRDRSARPDSAVLAPLPPPAMDIPRDHGIERSMSNLSIHPPTQPQIIKLHRSSTTSSQREQFERHAFRNSAILCDVRGIQVEYAHKVSADEDSHDVEMVDACQECRIAVVRKREAAPDAKDHIRVMTSIWVFSDDNTVRLELKMADGEMYVPYSSYFSPEKVSVTVPCELKFHDVKYGQRVLKTAKTSWINYVFESSHAAALFQNELMGRTLLATFRTAKTLRIHEGLSSAFTYAEQMCGMENLRIWEDNDTLAVIGLIHFSPQFRNGYLAFYLNSATNPIRVKDEGGKEVKIKGLRVVIDNKKGRKDSVVVMGEGGKKEVDKRRLVTGAKVEFESEAEKREFLQLVREVQSEMRELPDLAGVN